MSGAYDLIRNPCPLSHELTLPEGMAPPELHHVLIGYTYKIQGPDNTVVLEQLGRSIGAHLLQHTQDLALIGRIATWLFDAITNKDKEKAERSDHEQ